MGECSSLLRKYPDQAVAWADAICHNHGRNNYARILFVVSWPHSCLHTKCISLKICLHWPSREMYCIISVFAVFHLPIGLTLACIEVNSDHGAQTLLNLAVHGMHFERYMASTLAEAVATFGNLFVTTSETKLYKPWPNQGPLLMIYG